jgi:DNA-binding NarL/FixJ family response regulator
MGYDVATVAFKIKKSANAVNCARKRIYRKVGVRSDLELLVSVLDREGGRI